MEYLVRHAVTTIRERFWEPLSLEELARGAMVSKYHFLRVFTRVTGVTPGRFLCAVRLQEAKVLLLSTQLTVADIGARVGYSSTGSFTRRFTELVGLSPTGYRALSLTPAGPEQAPPAPRSAPVPATPPATTMSTAARPTDTRTGTGTVTGLLHTTGGSARAVRVGVFASPLLQGAPVQLTHASAPGPFTLEHIPEGVWYVHAVTRPRPTTPARNRGEGPSPARLTAAIGPVRVKDNTARRLEITLSAPDWSRPPVLSALMDLAPHPAAA
ncbi:helix-turn-helix transcriptional regulator [Streptomyces sp. NPDC090083]|uniref:helix-turn-helix transcriptional regulator n=1 Tax=Streptomyces sp. NPDC090083 TaxID=3365941 RepID=UPI00380B7280